MSGLTEPSAEFGRHESSSIIEAVHGRFLVQSEYVREDSGVEFNLDPAQQNLKSKFASLVYELRQIGFTSIVRRSENGYILLVKRKPPSPVRSNKIPLILLIVTIATIAVTGLISAFSYHDPFSSHIGTLQAAEIAGMFTAAVFGIVAIHEMGHKVASWYHKMDSSWPYFIPGIPGIWPTMGAVITTRDPPVNRDSLFDLGISGPLAGLVVAVLVAFVAVFVARLEPRNLFPPAQTFGTSDYFTSYLLSIFKHGASGDVVTGAAFSVLYFAYSFGFLLTFINLLPAWQLDGGHISNAAVSPRIHKWLTYVSVVIMFLIQFYLMGILILLLAGRTPGLEPLDNVSPLSTLRKISFILTWLLAIGIFVFVLNNGYFGLGLLFK